MAVSVRSAGPDDQAALRQLWGDVDGLHRRLARGFFRGGPPATDDCPPELRSEALAGLSDAGHTLLLLAEEGGRPAGALHATLHDTPRAPSLLPRRRLHVDTLVVEREQRRRGVGRLLMAAAERWGRSRGATQVVLTVWRGNGAAAGFYRSLGYVPVSQVLAREL